MLHYKELSYQENLEDIKIQKNDISVKVIEVKDYKIKFQKELWKKIL